MILGNDKISGGTGNDFLCGGTGKNILIGGKGRDIFKLSSGKGYDLIKDFKNTHWKSGTFQQFFHVYGKENENCSRISCKGQIKRIIISNRSSFYCNKCQK